jgi:ferrous iron transport protein B
MGILFQALFAWSDPFIGLIESGFSWLGESTRAVVPPGLVADFLVDGLINGFGSVLVFLPQILMLFAMLGFLEDSGYMARVAYLVDRGMKAVGLHGRAFVPMLSGYACAVPAIMATRTLERRRDRLLTMMVVPLMSCSARLPVYTLIIASLFPVNGRFLWVFPVQGAMMVFMYVFSTLMALIAAAVLGKTLLRGPKVPLLLELPPYRLPSWSSVFRQMWLRARMFVTEAGTVILGCTVVLWVLLSFPKETLKDYDALRAGASDEVVATLDAEEDGELLRNSYGGRLGQAIEPLIAPLGFDWKIGVGLVGAFAAREVFVSTMGVVYGIGADTDAQSLPLRDRIRAERHPDGSAIYTPLTGLSLMVFFALSAQCMSTLAVVKRESRSWRWPVFLFAYMTVLAWVSSFVVYQGGRALGLG